MFRLLPLPRVAWLLASSALLLPACCGGKKPSSLAAQARDHAAAAPPGGAHPAAPHAAPRQPPAPRKRVKPASQQAALPDPPRPAPRAARPDEGCGSATIGGERIPIDCHTDRYGEVEGASQVLHRSALNEREGYAGASPLPAEVDHRADGTEGAVRNQKSVGACTGFSLSSAIDHAMARTAGKPSEVSVLEVWSNYHLPSLARGAAGNRGKSLGPEPLWPYTPQIACSYISAADCKGTCSTRGAVCAQPVEPPRALTQPANQVAVVTDIHAIALTPASIKEALAKGQDVWMAMYVDDHIQNVSAQHPVIADYNHKDRRTTAGAVGGHALLLAGYRTQPNGTFYLLHNSWGEGWGDHGYAWIHERTLFANMDTAYLVDARPPGATPGKPPSPGAPSEATVLARKTGQASCAGDLVPDSITAECAPACPDESPRHDGACPVDGHCGPGEVNLTGSCVIAAPRRKGQDGATGMSWTCGAGGCTYSYPAGKYGCTGGRCQVSCPSPTFLVSAGPQGLSCAE